MVLFSLGYDPITWVTLLSSQKFVGQIRWQLIDVNAHHDNFLFCIKGSKKRSIKGNGSNVVMVSVLYGLYSNTCVKWPLKNRQNKDVNDKW